MYSPSFPPLLTYRPNTKTSKPMRPILKLIGFARNGADGHQMDKLMGKNDCGAQKSKLHFLNGLMSMNMVTSLLAVVQTLVTAQVQVKRSNF